VSERINKWKLSTPWGFYFHINKTAYINLNCLGMLLLLLLCASYVAGKCIYVVDDAHAAFVRITHVGWVVDFLEINWNHQSEEEKSQKSKCNWIVASQNSIKTFFSRKECLQFFPLWLLLFREFHLERMKPNMNQHFLSVLQPNFFHLEIKGGINEILFV
jgi:hypothetical protein